MPTAQTVFSRIWTLASLCALLGAAAIVLYFLSPGYGFADRDITPYYWGSVGLDGGIFLLCLPLIRLSRRLPEKARKALRGYLIALVIFLLFQLVRCLVVLACLADLLDLPRATVRSLEGARIGDWSAVGLLPYLKKVTGDLPL